MNCSRSLLFGAVGLSLWGCTRWGYEPLPDVDGQAGDASSVGSSSSAGGGGGTGGGNGGGSTGGDGGSGGSTGGAATGGAATGGAAAGGAATGGAATGGAATGGAATGGAATGGAATGGATTGGTGGTGTGGSGGSTSAPVAVIAVTPGLGEPLTVFNADASGSSDVEDAASALSYEWDWQSDGTYDDTGMTAQHSYGSANDFAITLRVTDTDGNSSVATRSVSVVAAGSLLLVTTAVDESNAGATPGSPGGMGFSLREAITYSNNTAGKQTIGFASPMVIMPSNTGLPSLDDATDLFGAGAIIDGTSLIGSGNCLTVRHTVRVSDLEIRNCAGYPILVQSADGAVVSRCHIHDNGKALMSVMSSNIVFGPGNVIANSGAEGILLQSDGDLVIGNEIYDNATNGVTVAGGALAGQVIHNLIVGGQTSVLVDALDVTVWQNTLVGASSNGIRVANQTGTKVQNNILFGAAGDALVATDSSFAAQDHNLFFGNGGAACNTCTLGQNTLFSDPLFVSSALRDYRLQNPSPAIDAGTDLGVDVNGSAAGNFNGVAPDIGYYEASPP